MITRTPIIDDDGTGTTGTVIDNAWKQEFYDQIDAALALSAGAPVNSPTFTGDPKAPTPAPGDNDTSIATTAFVQAALGFSAGSWTPLLTADGGGTPTYSIQQGSYKRMGGFGLCFVSFQINLASKGSLAGYVQLGGLPFLPAAPAYAPLAWDAVSSNPQSVMAQLGAGASVAYLRCSIAGSPSFINNAISVAQIANNSIFSGAFIYQI